MKCMIGGFFYVNEKVLFILKAIESQLLDELLKNQKNFLIKTEILFKIYKN